jgi:hypothetical protein
MQRFGDSALILSRFRFTSCSLYATVYLVF